MTKRQVLGRSEQGDVKIDFEALVGTHLCIQGNSGAGKSRTIRKLLELAAGHAQRIVIDVEDEFHTLREASPRMVIAGGQQGDCPATVANAAALARFVLESGVDAVLQINELGLDGRREFIGKFLQSLIDAPRHLWHPALIVLDETHRYCPLMEHVESSDAVKALASEGRKRGFTAVYATQRLAKISKDATGDINNWLMGRVGQALDRRAVADELGFSKAEARDIGRLKAGHFWAFGPALVGEPTLVHVGDVETTHIKSGQRGVPVPPAPSEIQAMMAQLHVEPPKEKAKPKIEEAAENETLLNSARDEGYRRGKVDGYRDGLLSFKPLMEPLRDIGRLGQMATEFVAAAEKWMAEQPAQSQEDAAALPAPQSRVTAAAAPPQRRAVAPPAPAQAQGGGAMTRTTRKILDAIHSAYPVALTFPAAAARAAVSRRSSQYRLYEQQVRNSGEVQEVNGRFRSAKGFAHPVASNGDPIETWASRLPPSYGSMLREVARSSSPLAKEEIAARAGVSPTSSGLSAGLRELIDLALVEPVGDRYQLAEGLRG